MLINTGFFKVSKVDTIWFNLIVEKLQNQIEDLQKEVETLKKNRTRDRGVYIDNTMTPNRNIY